MTSPTGAAGAYLQTVMATFEQVDLELAAAYWMERAGL